MVLLTPQAIEKVAGRIEQAYALRFGVGPWAGPGPRLWEVVARALVEAHRASNWLPLDPELLVACLPPAPPASDPWTHVEPARAIRRYRRRIRRICRDLRRELVVEVRQAETRLGQGQDLESVLNTPSRRFSPLGRYIVAYRQGRPDLAEQHRVEAQDQHAACPLYRVASRSLLPQSDYPILELLPGLVPTPRLGPVSHATCPN